MTENLKIKISAEISDLKKNIAQSKKEIQSFKEQFKKAQADVDKDVAKMGKGVATAAGAITAAAGAAAAGLYKMATESAATADEIDKMSQKIGISREAYQEWNYICSQSGVEVSVLKNGVKTLTTQMDAAKNGTESAIENFKALGLTWEDGNGKLKSQEQMMEEAITALAGMEDGTERARLAQELFGKAGLELEPVLNSGVDGIEALRDRCHDLGLVMSDEAVNAGVKLGDTIADVKDSFGAITDRLGSQFMPIIQQVADMLIDYMPTIEGAINSAFDAVEKAIEYVKEHQGLFTAIAVAIGVIVGAIGLYNAIAAIKAAMDAAQVSTLAGLITAHLAHAAAVVASLAPYIAITAAIAALIAIIVLCVKNWDKIIAKVKEVATKVGKYVGDMKDKVVNKFNEIKEGIANKIQAVKDNITNKFTEIKTNATNKVNELKTNIANKFSEIKEKITAPVENAKNKVKEIVDKIKGFFNFQWSLPKLKVPKFSITPSGWSVGDLLKGSIPKLSVAWNARGGIFDKPTLFGYGNSLQGLGENGAEAVVPLEKNTQWLDKIADRLAAKQGSTPIVLQVDGKTFAEVSVASINDLTKMRGSIPLKLM